MTNHKLLFNEQKYQDEQIKANIDVVYQESIIASLRIEIYQILLV